MLVGPRLVDVYVNWLWFGEVGFRRVWITVVLTRGITQHFGGTEKGARRALNNTDLLFA